MFALYYMGMHNMMGPSIIYCMRLYCRQDIDSTAINFSFPCIYSQLFFERTTKGSDHKKNNEYAMKTLKLYLGHIMRLQDDFLDMTYPWRTAISPFRGRQVGMYRRLAMSVHRPLR